MASRQAREQVQSMYIAYYGRPGDSAGVEWWANELDVGGGVLHDILPAFGDSQEYLDGMAGLDIGELIDRFYMQMFNRVADLPGWSYYRGKFLSGELSLTDIAKNIWDGAEGMDRVTLANKLAFAEHFGAQIDSRGLPYGPLQLDMAAQLLAGVDSTTASMNRSYAALNDWLVELEAEVMPPPLPPDVPPELLPELPELPSPLLAAAQARSQINAGTEALVDGGTREVRALDSGYQWTTTTVSYSFPQQIPSIYLNDPELRRDWRPFDAVERSVALDTIDRINALIGIELVEDRNNNGLNGEIRLSAVKMNGLAGFAYFPGRNELAGDVVLDRGNGSNGYFLTPYSYGTTLMAHELGHALGLTHPFEGRQQLPTWQDHYSYTVMSYVPHRNQALEFSWSGRSVMADFVDRYPDDFSLLDVQALQSWYGANLRTGLGDDVYRLDPAQGERLTLWDVGGHDVLELSEVDGNSQIDLRGGTLSSVGLIDQQAMVAEHMASLQAQGAPQADWGWLEDYVREVVADHYALLYNGEHNLAIVQGTVIEDVYTGSGDDVVWDNAVDNRIVTGAGDDTIHLGAGGFDFVDGGAGFDVVVLGDARAAVEYGMDDDGSVLLVGSGWAARLVNVERVAFSDGEWMVG